MGKTNLNPSLCKWMLAAPCVLALGTHALLADTVSLSPVADSHIRQLFDPDTNYGTLAQMWAGTVGDTGQHAIRRALMRFDLSGQVPAGAVINSVSLRITVVKVPPSAANSVFDLRRILQPWNELTVTWNSRLGGSSPWQVPGAGGAQDAALAASSSIFVSGL